MINYKENNVIEVDELKALYDSVGWSAYTDHPEIMQQLLPGAQSYISAWDGESLIGLIRTVGDGCYMLYIQDLLIHPDYQRKGIGTVLIKKILEDAKGLRQILLSTDHTEKTIRFYRSVGFSTMEEMGAVTLTYRGND